MLESVRRHSDTVLFRRVAFRKIYSKFALLFAPLTTLVGGSALGVGLLLASGQVPRAEGSAVVTQLDSLVAVGLFTLGLAVVAASVSWVTFAFNAPRWVDSELPKVTNPLGYALLFVFAPVLLTGSFWVLSTLNALFPPAGLVIIGYVLLRKALNGTRGASIVNTQSQQRTVSLLLTAVLVGTILYGALGPLAWVSDPQWFVLFFYLYLTIIFAQLSVRAPLNQAQTELEPLVDDYLPGKSVLIPYSEFRTTRWSDNHGVDVDYDASGVQEAVLGNATSETSDEWVDLYLAYNQTYERLAGRLDTSVKCRAVAGRQITDETRIAIFVENLHPRHYTDIDTATRAADIADRLVDQFVDNELFESVDRSMTLRDLSDGPGPTGDRLDQLEAVTERSVESEELR